MAAVGLDSTLSSLGLSRAFAEQLARSLQVRTAGPKSGADALLLAQYNAIGLQNAAAQQGSNGKMSAAGWVPGPQDYLAAQPSGLQTVGNGFGGLNLQGAFATDPLMQSLQAALASNPQFRTQLESALGGQVIGGNNGALSVWQPSANAQTIGKTTRGLLRSAPPAGSIQYSLGNMNTQVTPAALNGPQGGILRGLMQMEANIASFASNMGTGGIDPAVAKAAQSAGVDTKNPRFEDLVFLNMMSYTHKKEGEIMGKVNALGQNAGAFQQEGFFGGLTSQVGGETARQWGVDIPEAANFAAFGGVQAQAAGAVGAVGAGGAVVGAAGAATGGTKQIVDAQGNVVDPSSMSETAKQQMLQKMMGDLQKLYEMLSNMNKSMHDMQKTAINNLRA